MYKGSIEEKQSIRISFHADHTNDGSTAVMIGYIPREASSSLPDPVFETVAPGGTVANNLKLPAASVTYGLRIQIDVPNASGSGRLIVKRGNTELDNQSIRRDQLWTYAIRPKGDAE